MVLSHQTAVEDGGFDLIRLGALLWKSKWLLAAGTLLAALAGVVVAMTTAPVYEARAIIAQKEADKDAGTGGMLSRLGGLSGLVGSRLGVGGGSLNRIEVILRSHELADSVMARHNLMPRLCSKQWDAGSGTWKLKNGALPPDPRRASETLRLSMMNIAVDQVKGIIVLGSRAPDSILARDLIVYYLEALNDRLLEDVKRDAEINRAYLETQLGSTPDPMMKEKLYTLISYEIEKYMLVSTKSIDVLEQPAIPLERSAPRRKKIVLTALCLGFLVSAGGRLGFEFVRGMRRERGNPDGRA